MSDENKIDHGEKTREVYHAQHKRLADDEKAMNRFIGMFSTDYFGLEKDYFKNKQILDAGCGDTANLMIGLHRLGCTSLHGFDLGTEFIPIASKTVEKYGVPTSEYKLKSGSVLEIPYEDEYFDFVACHGVLLHLNDFDEVKTAFKELARVTKPGGYLYTYFGATGGLWEDALNPAFRNFYRTNSDFKKLIDNITPKDFSDIFDFISKKMFEHTGEKNNLRFLNDLFDTDLCVTIQNVIQAPVRLGIEEDFIKDQYNLYNFINTRKLNRYVKRQNIRKFLAPLHFEKDHPISKILYGTGQSEFLAQKKEK